MQSGRAVSSHNISVLVADSNHMQCQLLVGALRRRAEFRVASCPTDLDAILNAIAESSVDVLVMSHEHSRQNRPEMGIVRQLHLAHPQVAKVLLMHSADRDAVVNAFRSGARGLFCFSKHPFRLLCKCIQSVHQGQIWANSEQLRFLLDVVSQVPSLRVVNSLGAKLLTPREEQVVALVADGLSNRQIAHELQLSEHTVKKYLFRIFEKLGISSRVELVLYAVNHGATLQAEWVAAGTK